MNFFLENELIIIPLLFVFTVTKYWRKYFTIKFGKIIFILNV